MKRFRPEQYRSVMLTSVPVLSIMGLSTSSELLQKVREAVDARCQSALEASDLEWEPRRLLTMASKDIPITLDALSHLIADRMMTKDERDNVVFMLAKLADDLMQIGAINTIQNIEIADVQPIIARPALTAEDADRGRENKAKKEKEAKKPVEEEFIRICADLMQKDRNRLASQLIDAAVETYGDKKPVLPKPPRLRVWLKAAVDAGGLPAPSKDGRSRKS